MNRILLTTSLFANLILHSPIAKGAVPESQIRAAIAAEAGAATLEITIRSSGQLSQYHVLDSDRYIGKKINVNFFSGSSRYEVPQMVLTKDYLDRESQTLIDAIKSKSSYSGGFREVGAWILYTNRGAYISETFTSNEAYTVSNNLVYQAYEDVLRKARQAEGPHVLFTDISLFHTHLTRGEAFSPGDQDFQSHFYSKYIRRILNPNGQFASYAVPVQGKVLFRNVLKRNSW